ncbi:MAG: hypothetical protein AAGF47_11025 [Planctomycetota bacterium]
MSGTGPNNPPAELPAELVSSLEYLSAAYSAFGLYSPEHPLAVALSEAVADASVRLEAVFKTRQLPGMHLAVTTGGFVWQGRALMPGTVSPLASDLHSLSAIEITLAGRISSAAAHKLLASIYELRHRGGTFDELRDVAEGIAGRPIRFSSIEAEQLAGGGAPVGHAGGVLSDSQVAVLLRDPPDDPTLMAECLTRSLLGGDADEADAVRTWLLHESATACTNPAPDQANGEADPASHRKAWLTACIERLTPEVRSQLLASTPKPDPEWLLSAARLAPVWPLDELIAAMESLTGDVTSLRGSGRLLFTQLLTLATRDDQQQRVRSVISTWGAHRSDSSLFPSDFGNDGSQQFRSDEYADELMKHARREDGGPADSPVICIDDEESLAVRAAEIAVQLAEDEEDDDIAAVGVARTAESLIRRSRTDLIVRALANDIDAPDLAIQPSLRQRRLLAVLRKPDTIRVLLENLGDTHDEHTSMVRLLDLAGEHAATLALEFAATTEQRGAGLFAMAWFRALKPELRGSAIGEFLSAQPDRVGMLEPLCDGISTIHIGHCVEHLVSPSQPEHARAVLRVLGWCSGAWPASVVHYVASHGGGRELPATIAALTSGPAETRSDTIARVLCSWVSLHDTPIADVIGLVDVLRHDQSVAERAFVQLLRVIRGRVFMVARGDAEPLLEALHAYPEPSEAAARAIREWRSLRMQLIRVVGSFGRARPREKRCA